ncbi:hypothetical protein [Cyanobium sp. LEGE 06143]|nr:hypothetical protein [Cyanobium sp. LEGE 06143]
MKRSPFTILLVAVVVFDLVFLMLPNIVVALMSFTAGNLVTFPP